MRLPQAERAVPAPEKRAGRTNSSATKTHEFVLNTHLVTCLTKQKYFWWLVIGRSIQLEAGWSEPHHPRQSGKFMKLHAIRFAALASLAFTLVACGGGGGGGGEAAAPPAAQSQALVRAALPTVVQDIEPAGARIDLRTRNYFPLGNEDTLTYDKTQGSTVTAGAVKRTTSAVSDFDPVISEVEGGVRTSFIYRRTANGILAINPLGNDAPAAVSTLVGNVLEYPEPFFAIGAVRTVVRQGGFGADLDGDGIQESFRLEIKQSLVGLETLPLPVGTAEMAHFTTISTLTISPSRQSSEVSTVVTTENSWFAPGIGLARADYVSTRPDGTVEEPFYSIALASGRVNGQTLFTLVPGVSSLLTIPLTHNALVFDAPRNRYYATVASSVVGQGNRIATIEPTTGAINYSAVVGSEPSAMAFSADGNSLYVGLNVSGEVVKLRLPDMVEQSRFRLPIEEFGLRGPTQASSIAPSPTEPDVVAVSISGTNNVANHLGVVLVRNGALQPRRTALFSTSDLIVFDPAGQFIYGYNSLSTEFGLRRIQVVQDGVVEQAFLRDATSNFGVTSIDASPRGLVLDSSVFRGSDFTRLGRLPNPIGLCRAHTVPNRLICLADVRSDTGRLAVVDATSFVVLSRPDYGSISDLKPLQLVPGPAGQVALRYPINSYTNTQTATSLKLFNHPDLK